MALGFLARPTLLTSPEYAQWDGIFKYLLNNIDHGVKKLTLIPLANKQASSVDLVLLTNFTEQDPPSILQTDNGGEFSGFSHNHVRRRMEL